MNINTATQKKYRNTWSKEKRGKEERNGKQQTKCKYITSSTFICETSFHSNFCIQTKHLRPVEMKARQISFRCI